MAVVFNAALATATGECRACAGASAKIIGQETERETFAVSAPDALRLGDGTYRMYYAAWTKEIPGGVFTATSVDGLAWKKEPDPCLYLDTPLDCDMVSEPCVTELPDGRARLFYEARDQEGNCRHPLGHFIRLTSAPPLRAAPRHREN
jgi:hypothetical protein